MHTYVATVQPTKIKAYTYMYMYKATSCNMCVNQDLNCDRIWENQPYCHN